MKILLDLSPDCHQWLRDEQQSFREKTKALIPLASLASAKLESLEKKNVLLSRVRLLLTLYLRDAGNNEAEADRYLQQLKTTIEEANQL